MSSRADALPLFELHDDSSEGDFYRHRAEDRNQRTVFPLVGNAEPMAFAERAVASRLIT